MTGTQMAAINTFTFCKQVSDTIFVSQDHLPLQIKKSAENLLRFNRFVWVNPSAVKVTMEIENKNKVMESTMFRSW
jgi:hypothetical protein